MCKRLPSAGTAGVERKELGVGRASRGRWDSVIGADGGQRLQVLVPDMGPTDLVAFSLYERQGPSARVVFLLSWSVVAQVPCGLEDGAAHPVGGGDNQEADRVCAWIGVDNFGVASFASPRALHFPQQHTSGRDSESLGGAAEAFDYGPNGHQILPV